MPISHNLAETGAMAVDLVNLWQENKVTGATVVGLIGDLGAGKTAFTQAVAEKLGVDDHVTSPTFVIEKIYALKLNTQHRMSGVWKHLVHIDAYRLDDAKELLHLGWQELINDPANLILVEWADRVEAILPVDTHKIFFKFVDESAREINTTN